MDNPASTATRADRRKAEIGAASLKKRWKKSTCISLSASLTPKVSELTGVSARSPEGPGLVAGIPPKALPPSPPSWGGRSGPCPPGLPSASLRPQRSLCLPLQRTQAGPFPQGGLWEGAQLCPPRVSGGSGFIRSGVLQSGSNRSDLTRSTAPVRKDTATASPPRAASFAAEPPSAGAMGAHGKNNNHTL